MPADNAEKIDTLEYMLGSQKALAKYLNVTPRAVRGWKGEEYHISPEHQKKLNNAYKNRIVWHNDATEGQKEFFAHSMGVKIRTANNWLTGKTQPSKKSQDQIELYKRQRGTSTMSRQARAEKEPSNKNAMYQAVLTITKNKTKKRTTYEVKKGHEDRTSITGKQFFGDVFTFREKEAKRKSVEMTLQQYDQWLSYEGFSEKDLQYEITYIKRYNFLGV